MMLRKRNLNIQNNTDLAKDVHLAKRKNSSAKGIVHVEQRKALANYLLPEVRMLTQDPVPEYDFDAEVQHDPYAVATYARDIFIYYKYREQFFKVGDYFLHQKGLNRESRIRLVDWMVEVQETFELNHETLYLAVKLMDLYLHYNVSGIDIGNLQLVCMAAVFIASKYDERSPPLIDDFIYLSNDVLTRGDIIDMEAEVFRGVRFDLGAPISYRFLRRYARVMKLDMATLTLARYILETSLIFLEFCRVSESLIALACYLLAVRMKKSGDWSPILQKYSGYTREEVEPLIASLNHMMIRVRRDGRMANTIITKYSHEIFFNVTDVESLPDVLPANAPIGPPSNLLC